MVARGVAEGFGSSVPSSLSLPLLHIPAADLQVLRVPTQRVPGSPRGRGIRGAKCWKDEKCQSCSRGASEELILGWVLLGPLLFQQILAGSIRCKQPGKQAGSCCLQVELLLSSRKALAELSEGQCEITSALERTWALNKPQPNAQSPSLKS